MGNYRKLTRLAYAAMVVATIWLLSPAMAASGDPGVAKQAWPLIKSGALVIDVRTQEEFDEGHLEGTLHIPHENIDAIIDAIGNDQERQVVVYCRSGKRAGIVQDALAEAGFHNVFNATGLEALQSTQPDFEQVNDTND